MEKFKEIKKIGDGSFGIVIKAQDITTQELVAIKKMKQKYSSWDECINLRELKALQKLKHINIVKLKEGIQKDYCILIVIRVNDELSFVFEFVDKSIYQLYTSCKEQLTHLPETQIKSIIFQSANALAYMHKHGFFHRDLKPENMLMGSDGILKIIDFGLAREIRSRPPFTDYVATRWYRAPEILLQQPNYNSPVDIFALGCIMCELYLNKPLFSGSSEMDQFNKLLSILGLFFIKQTFSQQEWSEGHRLLTLKGITVAQFPSIPLNTIIQNASPDAINLIQQMLKWDPNKRIKASQILQHPFFVNPQNFVPALVLNADLQRNGSSNQQVRSHKQLENNDMFDQQIYSQQQQQQQQPQQLNSGSNINLQLISKTQKFPMTELKQKQIEEPIKKINSFQPSYNSNKQIKQLQNSQEFENLLDLLNDKGKESIQKPKVHSKPPQIPGSFDLLNYQNQANNINTVTSALRIKRNSMNESMEQDRNNSIGGEQTNYAPTQLMRKNQNSGYTGLSVPPINKKDPPSKSSYSNSIYNFDNVKYMPDQNFRLKAKQP